MGKAAFHGCKPEAVGACFGVDTKKNQALLKLA